MQVVKMKIHLKIVKNEYYIIRQSMGFARGA